MWRSRVGLRPHVLPATAQTGGFAPRRGPHGRAVLGIFDGEWHGGPGAMYPFGGKLSMQQAARRPPQVGRLPARRRGGRHTVLRAP